MKEFFAGPHLAEEPTSEFREHRAEILEKLAPHIAEPGTADTVLNDIDFPLLNRILADEFEAGVGVGERADRLPPIPGKEDIVFTDAEGFNAIGAPENSTMTYMPTTGLILVNMSSLAGAMMSGRLSPRSIFLEILFHEMNHVISAHSYDETESEGTMQVGVEEMVTGAPSKAVVERFGFMNEAINETRARQLAAKYLRANPLDAQSQADADRLEDIYFAISENSVMMLGPIVLKTMAEKIAVHAGVPADVVWKSFWHAELNGLRLASKEVKKTLDLDAVFGRGFTNSLAQFTPIDAVDFLNREKVFEKDVRAREFVRRAYGI